MATNDNSHLVRMKRSLEEIVGGEEARNFEKSFPLSKSASIGKKFQWAEVVCDYLEKNYTFEKNIMIREGCICNDGKTTAKKMKKYLNDSSNIFEFVQTFNKNETFACLEYIHNRNILFCYPQCYCGCVKRIKKPLPKTWCYCTLGYAKSLFEKVFDKSVKVELFDTIKSGGNRCAVSVEW